VKSTVIKIACIAVLASALSGCIIYTAPDHHHHMNHDAPAYDEKPADTTSAAPNT